MNRSKLTTPSRRRGYDRGFALLILILGLWGLPSSVPAQVVVDDNGKVGIGNILPANYVAKLVVGSFITNGGDYPGTGATTVNVNSAVATTHPDNGYQLTLTESSGLGADKGGGIGFQALYESGQPYTATVAGIKGLRENAMSDNLSGYLQFFTRGSAGSNVERMRITSSGNVGIGTTSPAANLHINGRDDVSPSLTLRQANNPAGGYDFDINNSTGHMNLYGNNEGPRRMLMQFNRANGNIGIGFTSLGNILTVAQNSATDPIADAWTTYSSIRWKENIVPFSGALQKIDRLRTVYFDWKQTKQRDMGMIAEEVGAVIPEAVAYEDNGKDAKSIDYGRLTAFLVAAIKEQQDQIKAQHAAIKTQQAEIHALRQDLAALQRTHSLSLVSNSSH